MSRFAEYRQQAGGPELAGLELLVAEERDVPGLARITAQREEMDPGEVAPRLLREVQSEREDHRLWVARLAGEAIAFGRASFAERPEDCAPNHQPEGWYLGGVIVDEPWRRRRVGHRLTLARLEYLCQRVPEVFYVASALNQASIDLHARFGFRELTRDFLAPRLSFTGGVGILFRLDLEAWQRDGRPGR